MRADRLFPVLSVMLLLLGCGKHPEAESGEDAFRDTAPPAELGTWLPDTLDPAGDRTDWKRIELQEADFLRVRVVVVEPRSAVSLGLYDIYGLRLAEANKPSGAQMSAPLDLRKPLSKGSYFVRIRADDGPKTNYSFRADLGAIGGSESGPSAPADEDAPPE